MEPEEVLTYFEMFRNAGFGPTGGNHMEESRFRQENGLLYPFFEFFVRLQTKYYASQEVYCLALWLYLKENKIYMETTR